MAALAPLEDPDYQPRYVPENGRPPAIVAKWGPRSQVRWFRRFWNDLGDHGLVNTDRLEGFYCHSTEHTGPCCSSCMDYEDETPDRYCCCKGYEAAKEPKAAESSRPRE